MNGENTGSKVNPDAAHQEMQNYFQPEDYCTSMQIRTFNTNKKWQVERN